MIAERISQIPVAATSGMRIRATLLKEAGKPIVNLAAGELDFGTCQSIKESAILAIQNDCSKYTDTIGIKELKNLIVRKINEDTNLDFNLEEVAVTSGAKQALYNSIFSIINPGDEVIVPVPYWVTYPAQITLAGGKTVFLDTEDNYQIDIKKLQDKISAKTKAIILNSPNNPTGAIYEDELLRKISELALKHNIWVIFDECYEKLVYKPSIYNNILKICPELRRLCILINSFSKSSAITGWRVGFLYGPEEIIKAVKKLQSHSTSNPNNIAQYGLLGMENLSFQKFSLSILQKLSQRRKMVDDILSEVKGCSYLKPAGAFYYFINVSSFYGKEHNGSVIENSTQFAEELLEKAQVATVPGASFGDDSCIRISFAISDDELSTGLKRFKQFLTELE